MRQTLRAPPNRTQIGPKSIQGAPSDSSSDLLGRLRIHHDIGWAGRVERLIAPVLLAYIRVEDRAILEHVLKLLMQFVHI